MAKNLDFCDYLRDAASQVLKRFWSRTNIVLMFLFPWLDWGIDISDFEKIDFLAHEPYLAFLAPWKGAFLGPQVEFRPQFGGVEYSTCPKIFIFEKYNISAFKWRVERFSTTLKEKKAACLRKKGEKKHPEAPFDWRVSKSCLEGITYPRTETVAFLVG